MTARGRRATIALTAGLLLLAGCDTAVSGSPAPGYEVQADIESAVTTTTTTSAPVTPTTTKPKPKPSATATHRATQPPATHRAPATHRTTTHKAPPPAPPEKTVTYLITGSGDVSVSYLAGGTMHSASHVSLPWRKTVPLSSGSYQLDITTGSSADVDEQVSVEGVVVGTGHNTGAGSGSFSGSY